MRESILDKDIERILCTEEDIAKAVSHIAVQIDNYYSNSDAKLVLVCILKGSVVFMGDLMKQISIPTEIDFLKIRTRNGVERMPDPIITLDVHRGDLEKCDILLVEDILDSGFTLSYLIEYFKKKGVHSVRTCTLLDKPICRDPDKKNFRADFIGYEVPDEFVVGYGLDYNEKYRCLPYVGVLKRSIYEKPDEKSKETK